MIIIIISSILIAFFMTKDVKGLIVMILMLISIYVGIHIAGFLYEHMNRWDKDD
ncbi:hypothetical protein C5S42_00260 [Candidatus Methanomarinus sp.]|nr:hypothetical protein C5S42_00260 [ANME-2 cluster archaeon]